MRYFTKELLSRINDSNEYIRAQAEKDWSANSFAYQQQFEAAKKHLSRKFINSYLSRNGMHDYSILGIVITKRGQAFSCELQLSNGLEAVLIVMVGIKAVKIDINSFIGCVQGRLAWGFSEFEITADNNVNLAVLCDEENEMQFEFEKIRFIKQ
jgi:hypothetical protein